MNNSLNTRKHQHLIMAASSQTSVLELDNRFDYEPMLAGHQQLLEQKNILEKTFLGKKLQAPMWVSSMTGGTGEAAHINQNLAKASKEFGLGMGLGSCRPLLESDKYFEDFNLRPLIGDQPFYANFGLAQIEQLIRKDSKKLLSILKSLDVDGLFVHINPLQEWHQDEGDRFCYDPIETLQLIKNCLHENDLKILVKEVGQGMGPRSLKSLFELQVDGIEFGAFGGTNFSLLEAMRSVENKEQERPLAFVGHSALDMVHHCNCLASEFKVKPELIISGGIAHFLDGYYLLETSKLNSVYAHARVFLEHATQDYESLQQFMKLQIESLIMAKIFLKIKEN